MARMRTDPINTLIVASQAQNTLGSDIVDRANELVSLRDRRRVLAVHERLETERGVERNAKGSVVLASPVSRRVVGATRVVGRLPSVVEVGGLGERSVGAGRLTAG